MTQKEQNRRPTVTTGSAGVVCHIPGGVATVSSLAAATGGIRPGGFVETDV